MPRYINHEEQWFKTYKHNDRYFIYAYDREDYPLSQERLERLASELPNSTVSTTDYDAWLCAKRVRLDQARREHLERTDATEAPDPAKVEIRRLDIVPCSDLLVNVQWFCGFDWELDLDNEVLIVKGFPYLSLRRMPPIEVLNMIPLISAENTGHTSMVPTDFYGHRHSPPATVSEYRFDPVHDIPPSTTDSVSPSYESFCETDSSPNALSTILGNSMACDEVSIKFREICIGAHVQAFGQSIMRVFGFARDRSQFTKWSKALALTLASTVLLPIHLVPADLRSRNKRYSEDGPFWWIRGHICLSLTTHLHIESRRKAAVAELREEILRRTTKGSVVFGVAFSVFHCVVVRVNGSTEPSCVHSDALQFLPSFYASSPSTTGISALVRLGNRPGADDSNYFHGLLTAQFRSWDKPRRKTKTDSLPPPYSLLRLPIELIGTVGMHLDAVSLDSLAITCTRAMEACLPLLRFPQLLPDHFPIGAKWCLLLTEAQDLPVEPLPSRTLGVRAKMQLFSGCFRGRSPTKGEVCVFVALWKIMSSHRELRTTIKLPAIGPVDFLERVPELEYSQGAPVIDLEDS